MVGTFTNIVLFSVVWIFFLIPVTLVVAQQIVESPNLRVDMDLIESSDVFFQVGETVKIIGFVEENHGKTTVGNVTIDFFLLSPNANASNFNKINTHENGTFSLLIPINSNFILGKYQVTAEPNGLGYQPQLESDKQKLEFFVIEESNYSILPPLKQLKYGVSIDELTCKDGFELIFKNNSLQPACVKSTSLKKFIGRGWIPE